MLKIVASKVMSVEQMEDPEIQAEILRRREDALDHPDKLEPWQGTTERVRARLNKIRRQKSTAG